METVLVVSFQCLEMPAEGCPGVRSIQVGRHRYRIVLLSHLMAINAHPLPFPYLVSTYQPPASVSPPPLPHADPPTWVHLPIISPCSRLHLLPVSPLPLVSLYWLSPLYTLSPDAGSQPEMSFIPLPPQMASDSLNPPADCFRSRFQDPLCLRKHLSLRRTALHSFIHIAVGVTFTSRKVD